MNDKSNILQEALGKEMKQASDDWDTESLLAGHLEILGLKKDADISQAEIEEVRTTPLFSMAARQAITELESRQVSLFPQFSLLAGSLSTQIPRVKTPQADPWNPWDPIDESNDAVNKDPRIFLNVNAPWSAFICGSQGSGKSHTVSCMLENCLIPNSRLGMLPNPLAGLVFYHDTFTSNFGGQVCEVSLIRKVEWPLHRPYLHLAILGSLPLLFWNKCEHFRFSQQPPQDAGAVLEYARCEVGL